MSSARLSRTASSLYWLGRYIERADFIARLIEATVRVAHSLGMDTVAEGIETEAQSRVVTELGSDKGQGYLYSRPLAGPDLEAWLLAE